jgi:hypothetical protein
MLQSDEKRVWRTSGLQRDKGPLRRRASTLEPSSLKLTLFAHHPYLRGEESVAIRACPLQLLNTVEVYLRARAANRHDTATQNVRYAQ